MEYWLTAWLISLGIVRIKWGPYSSTQKPTNTNSIEHFYTGARLLCRCIIYSSPELLWEPYKLRRRVAPPLFYLRSFYTDSALLRKLWTVLFRVQLALWLRWSLQPNSHARHLLGLSRQLVTRGELDARGSSWGGITVPLRCSHALAVWPWFPF